MIQIFFEEFLCHSFKLLVGLVTFFASSLSAGQTRNESGGGGEKTEEELDIDGRQNKISDQLSS